MTSFDSESKWSDPAAEARFLIACDTTVGALDPHFAAQAVRRTRCIDRDAEPAQEMAVETTGLPMWHPL